MFCFGIAHAQIGTGSFKTNADNNTLLWEINGNGLSSPSYLFGTFHLLCSDDIVFSKNLKQAIDNSREIYMELDMDDPATIFGGLMVMNMKDGKKLKDFYPEGIYKRITDYFKDSLQTPIGLFQNIKPAFLISMLYPKMMPCQTVSSVEDEIMKLAKENDSEKEIRGLETIVAQAAVFDSIPYENQAEELLKTIDSMEKSKAMFAVMLKAYKNQQLDEIEKLINDPGFGMEGNQDVLLDNRNKNWVDQLKEIMKTKPVFIAVGAGHLPGKTGLIELLRGAGFTVRPLENR
jgi:uncharacterized protein YbaP (TraB family)